MDKKGIRNLGKLLRKNAKTEGFCDKAYFHISKIPGYEKARFIMIYLSLPEEAPTEDIVGKLLADGKRVCVPVTEGRNMTPAEIDRNTVYKKGAFGVLEPETTESVDKTDIDIVIAPGLLFDRQGSRCGYGKGCYDLFLSDSMAVKTGLCFDNQLVNVFPTEEHDVKMDYIVTEKGLIACEKKK